MRLHLKLLVRKCIFQNRPSYWSEDFSDMLKVVPGAYCNIAHGGSLPLHNDGFILDDGILPIGASIYARLVEKRG